MSAPKVSGSLQSGRAAPPGQNGSGVVAVIGPHTTVGAANTPVPIGNMPISQIQTLLGVHELGQCVAHMAISDGWRKIIAVPATATAGSNSAVAQTGTGPAITLSGTPYSFYRFKVEIILGGSLGTATYRYSLDNGSTWSSTLVTAATQLMSDAGVSSGVTLNFPVGTYVAGEIYTATGTGPSVSTTNLATAMDALKATPYEFDCVIVLTNHAGATDADRATAWETYYNAVATEAGECQSSGKPAIFVIPGTMPVATASPSDLITWATALAPKGLAVTRNRQINTVCGPCTQTNVTGDKLVTYWQSPIFEAARKLCAEPLDHDLGDRGLNNEFALSCTPIYNEYAFALLDDSSFITTVFENNQWFFSAGRSHSTEFGYNRLCNVRIANYIYRLAKFRLSAYLNVPLDRNSAADVTRSQNTLTLDAPTPSQSASINSSVGAYVDAAVKQYLKRPVTFALDQSYSSDNLRGNVSFTANRYTESITFTVTTE